MGSISLERKRERGKEKKKRIEARFYCVNEEISVGKLRKKIITYLHSCLHKYISSEIYKREEGCHAMMGQELSV